MDKEGEISMGGDRIHFYIEKREIEHHYYNYHIYSSFLLILKNQDHNQRFLGLCGSCLHVPGLHRLTFIHSSAPKLTTKISWSHQSLTVFKTLATLRVH